MGWNRNHDSPSAEERERHLLQLVQPLPVLMELSGKVHSKSTEVGKQNKITAWPLPPAQLGKKGKKTNSAREREKKIREQMQPCSCPNCILQSTSQAAGSPPMPPTALSRRWGGVVFLCCWLCLVIWDVAGSSRENSSQGVALCHVNTLVSHLLLSSPFRAIAVFTLVHPLPDSSCFYTCNVPMESTLLGLNLFSKLPSAPMSLPKHPRLCFLELPWESAPRGCCCRGDAVTWSVSPLDSWPCAAPGAADVLRLVCEGEGHLPELGIWKPLDVQISWVLPFLFSRLGCNVFMSISWQGPVQPIFPPLFSSALLCWGSHLGEVKPQMVGGVIGFPELLQTLQRSLRIYISSTRL